MSQIKPQGGTRQKRPPVKDPKHLAYIRKLPCLVSGRESGRIEACHVRFASHRFDKRETGKQERPSDCWAVPLSPWWHRVGPDAQHKMSEKIFWQTHNINVLKVCQDLYAVTGDIEAGEGIIRRARNGEYNVREEN